MIKPDAVQRKLVGKIIKRFELRGYKLIAMKFLEPSKELLIEHYHDLIYKPFFPILIAYMLSGPVVATVWEGKDGNYYFTIIS
jgi:nucleoside-diphosphate kinase